MTRPIPTTTATATRTTTTTTTTRSISALACLVQAVSFSVSYSHTLVTMPGPVANVPTELTDVAHAVGNIGECLQTIGGNLRRLASQLMDSNRSLRYIHLQNVPHGTVSQDAVERPGQLMAPTSSKAASHVHAALTVQPAPNAPAATSTQVDAVVVAHGPRIVTRREPTPSRSRSRPRSATNDGESKSRKRRRSPRRSRSRKSKSRQRRRHRSNS